MTAQLLTTNYSYYSADFVKSNEASVSGAIYQSTVAGATSQDGGVYRFQSAPSALSLIGGQSAIASPTGSSWVMMARTRLVQTPSVGDEQIYCGMNDGTNNSRIAFEFHGPGSLTVCNLRFDRAAVPTRTPLNINGTIGHGSFQIGAFIWFALVYLTRTNVISAYVNGVFAGSRNDLASAGPTTLMMPWIESTAFSTGTFDLDKIAFATTGPV
jgi:hypothetical protein